MFNGPDSFMHRRLEDSLRKRRRVTGSSEPDISEESDDEGSPPRQAGGQKVVRLVKRRGAGRERSEEEEENVSRADRNRTPTARKAASVEDTDLVEEQEGEDLFEDAASSR